MNIAIDEIIQNGQVFNVRREHVMDDLRVTVRSLFTDLQAAKADYMLVGDVAMLAYAPVRNTQDVHFIIDKRHIQRLDWQATLQNNDFGIATYRGFYVDLLLSTNKLFQYVLKHERTLISFDGNDVPCATRDGMLLLKLYALPSLYRQQNLVRAALYEADIFGLLQNATVDDEKLLLLLGQHLSAFDIIELRHILQEQRNRRRFT